MPIKRYHSNSPRLLEPDVGVEMARYMPFRKFVSLVEDRAVYFCRADRFEDKFEGTIPPLSRKSLENYFRTIHLRSNIPKYTESEVRTAVKNYLESLEILKVNTCISYWTHFIQEELDMWRGYSDMNEGVMIKTTFNSLIKGFAKSKDEIYCSMVKYIDWDNETLNYGNMTVPFWHKQERYAPDAEIRLISEVGSIQKPHNWENEPEIGGKKIPVELNELIKEVIISPKSDNIFLNKIETLVRGVSKDCKLSYSSLR